MKRKKGPEFFWSLHYNQYPCSNNFRFNNLIKSKFYINWRNYTKYTHFIAANNSECLCKIRQNTIILINKSSS